MVLIRLSSVQLMLLQMFSRIISEQCGREASVYGMMLRGHIFKILETSSSLKCLIACNDDKRCQSFNYVVSNNECELNNRTKEARPEDFVPDSDRYYFGKVRNRVPLGSIPELPAESCKEIKASEGEQVVSGNYWFKSSQLKDTVSVHCDMKTEDVDKCLNRSYACDVNANCTNTYGSHNCTCEEGYIGDGQSCQDIDECSEAHGVKLNICHPNASCLNTQGSYNCSCKPTYVGNGSICEADSCYNYQNLSDATRKSSYVTPNFPVLCDKQLLERWYRFVGAAGTKMPTTRVPAYRCGTDSSGWLDGAHPAVEDGEVVREVCFSDKATGCRHVTNISVKNCGSFFIYKLRKPLSCNRRYCGTD